MARLRPEVHGIFFEQTVGSDPNSPSITRSLPLLHPKLRFTSSRHPSTAGNGRGPTHSVVAPSAGSTPRDGNYLALSTSKPNGDKASSWRCNMGSQNVSQTLELAKSGQPRLKITFWIDVTLLASVCALQTVSFTGLVLHEWLGLALVGMVFAHLLLSWSWIASQSRRLFAARSARARVNYLLNLSLFGSVTAAIFSGVLISQKAIPILIRTKAAADIDWRWEMLHHHFSTAVILLAGFHLAINCEWALAAGEKIFRRVQEGAL
jgi:hypothetical protein